MYQLRIYAMRTADALQHYATVHWPRHIPSLRAFGVTTNGIWTQPDGDAHRLVALISYPDGINPAGDRGQGAADPSAGPSAMQRRTERIFCPRGLAYAYLSLGIPIRRYAPNVWLSRSPDVRSL